MDDLALRFKRVVLAPMMGGFPLWECQSCGALVREEMMGQHHEFHLHAEDTNRMTRGYPPKNEPT